MKKSVGLTGLLKIVSMVLSLVYVPVVMSYLGEYRYGVWATLLSVLSWISYFDIGIGNGLRNKLAEALAAGEDKKAIRSLVSSGYAMLGIIVMCVSLCMMACFSLVDWPAFLSADALDEPLLPIIEISLFGMGLNFIFSLCNSVFYALQKPYFVNLMGVVQQVLMIASIFALRMFGGSSLLLVALAYAVSNMVVYVTFSLVVYVKNDRVRPSLRYVNISASRSLVGLGAGFFVIQIAAVVLTTTDNLVVSHLFGPEQVTVYSTPLRVITAYIAVFSAIIAPYWSATTAAAATKSYSTIRNNVLNMLRILAVASAGLFVLLFFLRPLMNVWLGFDLGFSGFFVILLGVYAFSYMWNSVYSQVSNGLSLMPFMIAIALVQAVVNIPLSLLFAVSFGLGPEGVLLGTIVAMLISSFTYPPYTLYKLRQLENNAC